MEILQKNENWPQYQMIGLQTKNSFREWHILNSLRIYDTGVSPYPRQCGNKERKRTCPFMCFAVPVDRIQKIK